MKGIVSHKHQPYCRHCGATLEHTLQRCPKCGRRSWLSLFAPKSVRT